MTDSDGDDDDGEMMMNDDDDDGDSYDDDVRNTETNVVAVSLRSGTSLWGWS